ncbi:MAG: insulinase family protein [Holosporaceae bacterium]|jgi:zinc protease|nr:insulinase family protein [Holosporaceae bacterium]
MFRKIIAICSLTIFFDSSADKYRGASLQKLENGATVVFVGSTKSDSVLVMLCVSSGSTDEIEKRGVASLLSSIFLKKLKESVNADSHQYGSESSSYTGYDQSVYYLYGKAGNLEEFIKNLGVTFSDFAFSIDDLNDSKKIIEQQIVEDQQNDKNVVRNEARKSLYWHSNYGVRISGNLDDLKLISEKNVCDFKKRNYTKDRVTIIIVGNVDKKSALKSVLKYFGNDKTTSEINRLKEPPHHCSTVRITKNSTQVNVPIIEMYWKIPNYRNQKDNALAAEIFVNYLDEALQKNLSKRAIASMSFCYSFWNYDYGDFCMTITAKNSDSIEDVITAVLSEIKYIASEKITEEQAKKAAKKLSDSTKMFHFDIDVLDFVDWVSKKVGSCYDFDFLKSYYDFVGKFDINKVSEQAKTIFKNDPCVISIIKPAVDSKKNAN